LQHTGDKQREQTLAAVRAIVLAALGGHDADVYLFGSWARGNDRRSSDIDVAVDPHAPLPPTVVAAMRDALEESTIPYRVEIVNLAEAGPAFRARVLQEGQRWTG
jgi:hypothetical protein